MSSSLRIFSNTYRITRLFYVVLVFTFLGCEKGAEVDEGEPDIKDSSDMNEATEALVDEDPVGESTREKNEQITDAEKTPSSPDEDLSSGDPTQSSKWVVSYKINPHAETVVATEHGAIEGGVSDDESYLYWLGVPYAAPPVDEGESKLRWRAPRDPENWSGTLPTGQFQSHCVQKNVLFKLDADISGSEDCLYLNIWRPNTEEEDLPVLFWIHGGGFQVEAASMGAYNGARFATSQNVIVVTIDYRLGYLGWLYHTALHKDDSTDEDRSGNFALLDVIKALTWVQNNIEAFGGAKDKVTIAGQSAGGALAQALLVSPKVQADYLRGAIIQSGSLSSGNITAYEKLAAAKKAANTVVKKLLVRKGDAPGLPKAQELMQQMSDQEIETLLRETDAETLVEIAWKSSGGVPMPADQLFMDGHVLRTTAQTDFANDKYLHVPIMEGTTAQEGKMVGIFLLTSKPKTMKYLREEFDPNASNNRTAAQLLTLQQQALFMLASPLVTLSFETQGASLLGQISNSNEKDIFVYQFEYDKAPAPMDYLYASGHFTELPFVFGNIRAKSAVENLYAYFLDADETLAERTRLSQRMMNYWGSFVRNGNPNDPKNNDQPHWNRYTNLGALKRLHLGTAIYMMP